jgi:hypothetical protein
LVNDKKTSAAENDIFRLASSERELRLGFQFSSSEWDPAKRLFGLNRDRAKLLHTTFNLTQPSSAMIVPWRGPETHCSAPKDCPFKQMTALTSPVVSNGRATPVFWWICHWGGCSKLLITF